MKNDRIPDFLFQVNLSFQFQIQKRRSGMKNQWRGEKGTKVRADGPVCINSQRKFQKFQNRLPVESFFFFLFLAFFSLFMNSSSDVRPPLNVSA